eukprot:m.8670 g.8670  ORF g.8670 m.8670 type:complete len:334 (-) comp3939_c0_seq1:200-1201(-)
MGLYYNTLEQREKVCLNLAYTSAWFVFLLCFFAVLEICLSRKLKFQRFRLIAMLLAIQSIVGLSYVLETTESYSISYFRAFEKCPSRVGWSITNTIVESFFAGAIVSELVIVGVGAYSLFRFKKEVSSHTERLLALGVMIFILSMFSWLLSENIAYAKARCEKTGEATKIMNQKGREDSGISLGLICLLIMSYLVMFGFRLYQERIWKQLEMDIQGEFGVEQKERIIRTQRDALQEVIGFYGGYMAVSLLGITGIAVVYASFQRPPATSESYIMWLLGRLFCNLQGICQAVIYFYNERKANGLSWTKITKGLQGGGNRIAFAQDLEEHLIEPE